MPFDLRDVVKAYQPVLLGMALRLCRERAQAEDLVQATILKALESESDLRSPEYARTWLGTILSRLYIDWLRRPERRLQHEDVDGHELPEPRAEAAAPWHSVTHAVHRDAVARLPADLRKTYELAGFKQRPYKKVADTLGIDETTVATRMRRARLLLRDLLFKEESE